MEYSVPLPFFEDSFQAGNLCRQLLEIMDEVNVCRLFSFNLFWPHFCSSCLNLFKWGQVGYHYF